MNTRTLYVNREERDRIYNMYGHDIHWNSSPFPMALEELKLLYKDHTISFITARPHKFRTVTIDWLRHYNIKYHNIIYTEDKPSECSKLQTDVLIDDVHTMRRNFLN